MTNKITTSEAAAIIGVTPECLRVWRHRGIGPSYEMSGGFAWYDEAEAMAFVREPGRRGRKPGSKTRPKPPERAGKFAWDWSCVSA